MATCGSSFTQDKALTQGKEQGCPVSKALCGALRQRHPSLCLLVGAVQSRTFDRSCHTSERCCLFFPRVRTPCGRCAQVIIEGRETLHDDEVRHQKHNQTSNPKQTTTPKSTTKQTTNNQPRTPSKQVMFPLYGSETGETSSCVLSKGVNSR